MPVRSNLRRLRVIATGAVLAAGGLTSMAAPASASGQTADAATEVGPMAVAPPCVRGSERTEGLSKYADINNTCSRTFRVKAIIAFGFDGPCVTLDSGEGYTHAYGLAGHLDRIDLC
jgi:hypothetical protein